LMTLTLISRIGGDEYVVLLPNTTEQTAAEILERIRRQLDGKEILAGRRALALGTATKTKMEERIHDVFDVAEDHMYREKTGRTVIEVNEFLHHPVYSWMIGNIDGRITSEPRGSGVWECKVPGMRNFMVCKNEGPLPYHMIQMMHYLEVDRDSWGSFSIFNAELWEMVNFDVEKDEEFVGLIIEKEREFWKYVEEGVPPPEEEEAGKKILLPKVNFETEVVKIDSEGWLDATRTFRLARQLREEAEEVENESKERLINLMTVNKAEVAEGGGMRCYYRESKGKRTFDHKAFKDDHPDIDLAPWFKEGVPTRIFKPYFLREGAVSDE
ncbi:MAG: diguanylate cyclase, partial [Bacteroidia bacterium]|nr:diguanylate cyclase [Bacteroidia bacterium]